MGDTRDWVFILKPRWGNLVVQTPRKQIAKTFIQAKTLNFHPNHLPRFILLLGANLYASNFFCAKLLSSDFLFWSTGVWSPNEYVWGHCQPERYIYLVYCQVCWTACRVARLLGRHHHQRPTLHTPPQKTDVLRVFTFFIGWKLAKRLEILCSNFDPAFIPNGSQKHRPPRHGQSPHLVDPYAPTIHQWDWLFKIKQSDKNKIEC